MDGTQVKFGLSDSLCHRLSRTARLLERQVEEVLRQYGLTRIGWCILLAVTEEKLRNPSDIAAFVGIDRTATSRALRTLEADGLIAREMGRDDRRTTEVSVTEKGQATLMICVPLCSEVMNRMHGDLTNEDQAMLVALLNKLAVGGKTA